MKTPETMDAHHEHGPVEPLTAAQAEAFVGRAAVDAEFDREKPAYAFTSCIDDRDRTPVSKEMPVVRIPGDKLGLLMDALAGLNVFARSEKGGHAKEFPFDSAEIAEAVKAVIGEFAYHSDEGSEKRHAFACAGCGYCSASLDKNDEYLLPEEAVAYLKAEVPKLKEKGVKPKILKGAHAAQGVFIIDAEDVVLPSQSDGEAAYVYNSGLHRKLLHELARKLAPIVRKKYPAAALEDLEAAFDKAAALRMDSIVEALAKDLPKYVLSRTKTRQLIVKPLEVEPESVEA